MTRNILIGTLNPTRSVTNASILLKYLSASAVVIHYE